MDVALHGVSGRRRVHNITYGTPYQKAAALVDLAEDGSGLPEEMLELPNLETTAKLYFMFIRFNIIWTLNHFALIALNFFEKPLWCSSVSEVSCSNRDYYYLGELPYLTNAASLSYKGVTLVILVVHTLSPRLYKGHQLYWRSRVNKFKVIALFFLASDLLVDALGLYPVAIYSFPLRIAPFVRILFFIFNIRDLRDSLVVLGGMLGTYFNVLVLSLLYLLFYSWLAQVLFEDTKQGNTIFVSYPETLYQMFLLFSTSNNPDVWIPAYTSSRWSSIFFILYVLLGVYFVTNLILAVVYDSFKSELAKQVGNKDRVRTRILGKAFNLIDVHNTDTLNQDQCFQLFEELNNYRTLPKISKEDFELIFNELDDSHDFKINRDEFDALCHAITLEFQKKETFPWLMKFPFYSSPLSVKVKSFVTSPKFGYIIVIILLLNLAAVITERALDTQNKSGQKLWQLVEFVFAWIYVHEMALKVYAYGFKNYWNHVIGETITFISPKGTTFTSNGEWIRYLVTLRMIRLVRLITHVQRYRAFVATFLTLIPSLMPYLGTIFCVMCVYCSLGIQIFGGKVNAGNPDIPNSDLADNDYLLLNFNDYPNGMVTLFNLLVMGNWQVWMQDYATLAGTNWTYVYFISFYLITVLLLLNLIVAFVLEAFFAELELERPNDKEEQGEETSGKRGRIVGTKTRSQRVDLLLHQMLKAELHEIKRFQSII